MKTNWQRKLIVIVATMLLTMGTAGAEPGGRDGGGSGRHWWSGHSVARNHGGGRGKGGHFQAPEIDAASGTSAIALLTGMVLLMQERRRSKRSSKSNE